MLIAILEHTPAWVWALFTALIALGLFQTREREMSLTRVTVLPLVMIGLSLSGVLGAFGHLPMALGGWASGLAAALVFGRQFVVVRGAAWIDASARLRVQGSWLPLALMTGLFAVKYVAGVRLAMHHELAADAFFAGLVSLTYGAFSGLFLARGLALRRVARSAAVPSQPQAAAA